MDILFCVADHYEPDYRASSVEHETARVRRWLIEYPRFARRFRDADGRHPQHTFFYPAEVYRAEHADMLAELCSQELGEVEIHLHHGNDTAEALLDRLVAFKTTLAERHRLLSCDGEGRVVYGFIHGNWALDNGGGDPSLCGVNSELTVLRQTGCYADFTMPAAPEAAQSRIVNSIYYAVDDPKRPRSYDEGTPVAVGRSQPRDSLMLIQGPLMLNWRQRFGGILPRLENGALDGSAGHLPHVDRFARWVDAHVCVAERPEWVFVKVYTHGATEANADVMLGPATSLFHQAINDQFNDGRRYRLHYVTAREMFNIVKAAEAGHAGNPSAFRDFLLTPVRRSAGL